MKIGGIFSAALYAFSSNKEVSKNETHGLSQQKDIGKNPKVDLIYDFTMGAYRFGLGGYDKDHGLFYGNNVEVQRLDDKKGGMGFFWDDLGTPTDSKGKKYWNGVRNYIDANPDLKILNTDEYICNPTNYVGYKYCFPLNEENSKDCVEMAVQIKDGCKFELPNKEMDALASYMNEAYNAVDPALVTGYVLGSVVGLSALGVCFYTCCLKKDSATMREPLLTLGNSPLPNDQVV